MANEPEIAAMDETDISQEKAWYYGETARATVANLEKRNFNAYFAPTREEALSLVLGMIPEGATVGFGDSISVQQVGITAELKQRKRNVILDPFERDQEGNHALDDEPRLEMMRRIFFADVFLLGANAVTRDGKVVNVDGRGNRVAASIFGPTKVIIVAGVNKIVRNVEEALRRIREVAAPLNSRRHYLRHDRPQYIELPCVRTGHCTECNLAWRPCRYTVIMEGARESERDRIHVVLVGEDLGL